MNKMWLIVFLVFLCLFVYIPITTMGMSSQGSSSSHHPPSSRHLPPPHSAYHHIQFVQSWQPTYCKTQNCDKKLNRIFYTHGLWPADSKGNSLTGCDGPFKKMDEDQFLEIYKDNPRDLRDLRKNWRSMNNIKNSEGFWSHEWKDHGICSSDKLTPIQYFRKGVDLTTSINFLSFLNKKNIFPDPKRMYTREEIKTAIQDALGGFAIRISCLNDRHKNTFLREIYICLDPLVDYYVNCPGHLDNCGSSERRIQFPLDS